MLDTVLPGRPVPDPAMTPALAAAATAIARLDEALAVHPLRGAFLYRARLDAVRRQAAVDGQLIDPWQLAAVLEGLRLRMDPGLPVIERLEILDAARHALALHQWLVAPDFDEEGDVRLAEQHLAALAAPGTTPLLAAARGMYAWLAGGGGRPPIRAALVRFWTRHHVLRLPVPLTGAAALRAEVSFAPADWPVAFLGPIAGEAAEGRQLLTALEQAWFAARAAAAGRRRDSHAAAAIDLLAAAPLVSATTLAGALGVAVKTAIRLLDFLVAAGIAVELTRRSKRRLFGLEGMQRLADAARPTGPNPAVAAAGRPMSCRRRRTLSPRLRCRCRPSPRSSGSFSTTANSRPPWPMRSRSRVRPGARSTGCGSPREPAGGSGHRNRRRPCGILPDTVRVVQRLRRKTLHCARLKAESRATAEG